MKGSKYPLMDVENPELYRNVFPFTEISRVNFDHKIELIDPPEEIYITDTTFRDGQQSRPPFSVQQIEDLFDFLHRLERTPRRNQAVRVFPVHRKGQRGGRQNALKKDTGTPRSPAG